MLIYLDQNKWIELAQMVHGKDASARAKRVVRELVAAVDGKSAALARSGFHYIETSRISNVGRRGRLGEVMWRFSEGSTLLAYQAVVRHELEVALSKHLPQIVPGDIRVVGRGHAHAFAIPPLQGDVVVCEKHMADMLKRDKFRTVARLETNLEQIFAGVRGA